jgi:hypothetical protein
MDDALLGEQYDYDEPWVEECPDHGWQEVAEAVSPPLVVLVCGCEVESARA